MRAVLWSRVAAVFLIPGLAAADDVWELGSQASDDQPGFNTVLGQGVPQTHDLQGSAAAPDADWFLFPAKRLHSFEARVTGSTVVWTPTGASCDCASLD